MDTPFSSQFVPPLPLRECGILHAFWNHFLQFCIFLPFKLHALDDTLSGPASFTCTVNWQCIETSYLSVFTNRSLDGLFVTVCPVNGSLVAAQSASRLLPKLPAVTGSFRKHSLSQLRLLLSFGRCVPSLKLSTAHLVSWCQLLCGVCS